MGWLRTRYAGINTTIPPIYIGIMYRHIVIIGSNSCNIIQLLINNIPNWRTKLSISSYPSKTAILAVKSFYSCPRRTEEETSWRRFWGWPAAGPISAGRGIPSGPIGHRNCDPGPGISRMLQQITVTRRREQLRKEYKKYYNRSSNKKFQHIDNT